MGIYIAPLHSGLPRGGQRRIAKGGNSEGAALRKKMLQFTKKMVKLTLKEVTFFVNTDNRAEY